MRRALRSILQQANPSAEGGSRSLHVTMPRITEKPDADATHTHKCSCLCKCASVQVCVQALGHAALGGRVDGDLGAQSLSAVWQDDEVVVDVRDGRQVVPEGVS